MVFYEKINHRPPLEKMLIAFFKISRSNSASFNFFQVHEFFLVQDLVLNCLFQENFPFQILDNLGATYKAKQLLSQVFLGK